MGSASCACCCTKASAALGGRAFRSGGEAGTLPLSLPTQAATAAEAHRNLMLTKALDLSAKRREPVKLPIEPDEDRAAA